MKTILYTFFIVTLLLESLSSFDTAGENCGDFSVPTNSLYNSNYILLTGGELSYEITILSDTTLMLEVSDRNGYIWVPLVKNVYRYRELSYYKIAVDSLMRREICRIDYDINSGERSYGYNGGEYTLESFSNVMTYIPGTLILANRDDCFCKIPRNLKFNMSCDKDNELFEAYLDNNILPGFKYKAVNLPGDLYLSLNDDYIATFTYRVGDSPEITLVVKVDSLELTNYMKWNFSLGESISMVCRNDDNGTERDIATDFLMRLCKTKGCILNVDSLMEYIVIDGLLFKRIHTCGTCR